MLTDNIEWTADVTLLDFLRDVGKEFSVNAMIKKDSVRSRLEREGAGISFTEFSYMLLQAFDFYVLARDHGCTLQVGGSDQWGNITAGTELIRRKLGRPAYGLTFPLLLNADGSKFGKTAKGAVWLDPKRTSPFAFRQFWFKTSDAEVIPRMKYFSFIPIGEIQAIEAAMPAEPNAAQRRLAVHMTEIVHGREESLKVERAAEILFDPNGDLAQVPAEYLADAFDGAPVVEMARARFEGDGVPIVDLVSEVVHGGGNTRGAAKKDIEGKAIAVNGKKIDDREARVTASALLHAQYLVLRKGKRNQFLVKAI
jgi:tyrosyl-tRNA synthetase